MKIEKWRFKENYMKKLLFLLILATIACKSPNEKKVATKLDALWVRVVKNNYGE
jgi:hypothetical protein